MNTEVIIVKNAGHDIPRGYLQTALKNCPTYVGLSVQGDDGNGQPLLETSAEKKTYDVDDLVKLLADMKDVRVVLQLGSMHHDFDESSDMMPYTFQVAGEKKDDPPTDILAIHLEGDFSNYTKPGEGHTEAFNLWDDYLYPTISEKFEASEDLDNFFNRLRQSSFEKAVMNTVGHRGVAVFVPQYGEIVSFGRNEELGGQYDWGTTSNHFNWGQSTGLAKAAEAAVAAVKKPMGRLARAMGSTAVTPPASEPPAEDPKKHVHSTEASPKKLNDPKKDDNDPFAKWEGTSSKTHKMVSIPVGLQGNARNRWIRTFLGLGPDAELPKGKDHKDFKIPVSLELIGFAQESVSTNDDVKRLQSRIVRFQTPGGEGDAQPVTEPEVKNPQPSAQPDSEPVPDKRPPADFLPEMSADDKKTAVELATEWATNPKKPKALEIQKIVAKYPKLSATAGIKFSNYGQWTIADAKLLGKKAPNALALAFVELQSACFEAGLFDEVNTEEVNDKPSENSKSQTSSGAPAKSGPAPTKGGRLARAKGTAA